MLCTGIFRPAKSQRNRSNAHWYGVHSEVFTETGSTRPCQVDDGNCPYLFIAHEKVLVVGPDVDIEKNTDQDAHSCYWHPFRCVEVALALWMAFLIEEPSLCRAAMISPEERFVVQCPRASSHPNLSSRYIYPEKLVVALKTQTRSEVRLNLEAASWKICYLSPG